MNEKPTSNSETKQINTSSLRYKFTQGAFPGLVVNLTCSVLLMIIWLGVIFDWDSQVMGLLATLGIIKAALFALIIALPACGIVGLIAGSIIKHPRAGKIGGIITGIILTPFITALSFPRFYF